MKEQRLDLLAMGKAMTIEGQEDRTLADWGGVVLTGPRLVRAREARFAELNAMSKGQLARILRIQQEGGRPFPLPSTYMKKTKAELVWLLVDAELPLARGTIKEEETEMNAREQKIWLAKEAEELAKEEKTAEELAKAQAAIKKQREALQAAFDPMFETAAKPNKRRRKRQAKRPKYVPTVTEYTPPLGPDREPATEAQFLAAREKVVWKDGRVPKGTYIGGKRSRTTWPWDYLAKYYEDPVAWAMCKCLRLELDSATPWRFYTEGENVIFAPCLLSEEDASNPKIYSPEVWEKAAVVLEKAAQCPS